MQKLLRKTYVFGFKKTKKSQMLKFYVLFSFFKQQIIVQFYTDHS